jgi:hypothetical protein
MIKFDVSTDGGYHRYTVSFSTEEQALNWITARRSSHNVYEVPGQEIPEDWTRVLDLLYPTCHHGLDGRACMDPVGDAHWGTAEQERDWAA